jgi:hypothetical protein
MARYIYMERRLFTLSLPFLAMHATTLAKYKYSHILEDWCVSVSSMDHLCVSTDAYQPRAP